MRSIAVNSLRQSGSECYVAEWLIPISNNRVPDDDTPEGQSNHQPGEFNQLRQIMITLRERLGDVLLHLQAPSTVALGQSH